MEPIIGHSVEELGAALTVMEAELKKGQYAAVHLHTATLPTAEDLELADISMALAGYHVEGLQAKIIDGYPVTSFVLRKGSPEWALLIPVIVPVLTIGLITFGIFKIESITKALLPILLIAGGVVIITAGLLARSAERVTRKLIESPMASTVPKTKPRGSPEENPAGKLGLLPQTELKDKVQELWVKLCQWEGVPPESKFVVFSDDNPYLEEYSQAITKLLRFKQFESGEWQPAIAGEEQVVEIPFAEAPGWVRQEWNRLHPGTKPRVKIHRGIRAEIHMPYADWVVRDIVAYKGGQTMTKYVPAYESLISSTPEEQKLYFGGGVNLKPDEMIAVMDYSYYFNHIDLYAHPEAYEPPQLVAPTLTERQRKILATIYSYTSKYRREVFEHHKVTQAELDELNKLGLIDKRGAITILGRNVVGKEKPLDRWGAWPETTPAGKIPENLDKAVAVLEIVKRPGTYIGIMPTIFPGHYYKLQSPYHGLHAWGATSTYRPNWVKQEIELGYLRLVRGQMPGESFQTQTIRQDHDKIEKWYKKGIDAGRTDVFMDMEKTIPQTFLAEREGGFVFEDAATLVAADQDEWEQTNHFLYTYGAPMWDDTTGRQVERENMFLELRAAFWNGFLDGKKQIGHDIIKLASDLVTPTLPPEPGLSAKTKLPREWTFPEGKPEPILEVTPGMLPPTQTVPREKGWQDFYTGNRVQAVIDSTNWRIKARNVSEEEQKKLHESLKTEWRELVEYQNLQAMAFATGKITKEEAQQLYQIYGGESPSPEKWDKLTLAEKVAGTRFAEELLSLKLKRSPQTVDHEKQTLWDRAMYLLQKQRIRDLATADEIDEIMSYCATCAPEILSQMSRDLDTYPLFDAIAMWVEPVGFALSAYEPKVYEIARIIIQRYERQYSIKCEPLKASPETAASNPFVKVGERIRFIGQSRGRYETWPEGKWLEYGVTGAVKEFHPEHPAVTIRGEHFEALPPYAVVRWDFGGETCINPEDEGIRWERIEQEIKKLSPESTQGKILLDPALFPKRTEALNKLGAYTVLEVHDDGDLTVQSYDKKYVVTTEGEVFAHYTPGEALKKITGESQQEYQAITRPGSRILPFAGLKDNELVWHGEFPDVTLVVTVKDFDSHPKIEVEHAFRNSRAVLLNVVANEDLPISAVAKGEIWWFGTVDDLPVEVHAIGIERFSELELEDMFNNSYAVIKETSKLAAATQPEKSSAVIPTKPTPEPKREGVREYIADSPEYLAQTIDMTGWRQKLDQAFQEAVARTREPKEA